MDTAILIGFWDELEKIGSLPAYLRKIAPQVEKGSLKTNPLARARILAHTEGKAEGRWLAKKPGRVRDPDMGKMQKEVRREWEGRLAKPEWAGKYRAP